jgi:hypothetical protein
MLLGIASSIIVAVSPLISQGQDFSRYEAHDFPMVLNMDVLTDSSVHRFV